MPLQRMGIVLGVLLILESFHSAEARQSAPGAGAGKEEKQIGRAFMEISCSEAAKPPFQRGLASLHSFWYPEARKAFQSAAKADPECAMAYWGEAMSYNDGLHEPPSQEEVEKAQQAAEKARAVATATAREKGYLAAVEALYRGYPRLERSERDLAYSREMEKVYRGYPQDHEAAAFYALSLLALARRGGEEGNKWEMEAVQILEPIYAALPDHPGAAHYLIHAYDDSGLRERGLAAARRYAQIAPAVTHAQHMPSHIFAGVGMWDETIASNQAALDASPAYYHSLMYLVYARLEKGQNRRAQELVDAHRAVALAAQGNRAERRALQDLDTWLLLETRRWKEAASVPAYLDSPLEKADALYVRGLGAARSGDLESANRTLAELKVLANQLATSNASGVAVRGQMVAIHAKQVEAAIRVAEKRGEDAIVLMQEACRIADAPGVNWAPPDSGTGLPAHEFFGEILLELGRPEQAKREFGIARERTPGRLHSIRGLAKAAALSGDHVTAEAQYEALQRLLAESDPGLPEAEEARLYLASRKAGPVTR